MNRRDFLVGTSLCAGGLLLGAARLPRAPRLPYARTFYVNGKSGDDRQLGRTPNQAWQSLDRVNQEPFRPGDQILFRAGTRYRGQFKPHGSGAMVEGSVQPIIVSRYGDGPKPRIDGAGRERAAVYLRNVEYWEVTDLEVTNTGSSREAGRRGILIHAENFGTAHHIHLRNLHIHDVNGSLVKEEGGGSAVQWRNEGDAQPSRFDGLVIEGYHIERCARNAITGSGYWRRDQWHPSRNVVVRGNLIEEVPGDGIVPTGCDGALVEHNVMRDCPRLLPEGEAAAGIWPWSSDNTVIQFNEVSGHKAPWDAQGFDADWNCRGTLIQYNYSHDNDGGFLLICNNGEVGQPISVGNVGTRVRYNISVNDGLRSRLTPQKGMFSPAFHISGPVSNTQLYNNLIYAPKKPAAEIDRTLVQMDNWGGPWPQGTYFANNIFDVAEETPWDDGEATGTVFECNLYHGPFADVPDDPHALRVAPQFADAPATAPPGRDHLRGFRLQPSSPLIDAGTSIPKHGKHDFWGHRVPRGAHMDIGPGEHASRP